MFNLLSTSFAGRRPWFDPQSLSQCPEHHVEGIANPATPSSPFLGRAGTGPLSITGLQPQTPRVKIKLNDANLWYKYSTILFASIFFLQGTPRGAAECHASQGNTSGAPLSHNVLQPSALVEISSGDTPSGAQGPLTLGSAVLGDPCGARVTDTRHFCTACSRILKAPPHSPSQSSHPKTGRRGRRITQGCAGPSLKIVSTQAKLASLRVMAQLHKSKNPKEQHEEVST